MRTLRNTLSKSKKINSIAFTERELDVVACIVRGRVSKKIAAILSITHKTIETHVSNIMVKIGCHSREQVIDFFESPISYSMLQSRYNLLLEDNYFNSVLEKFKVTGVFDDSVVELIYQNSSDKKTDRMVNVIKKHIERSDIKLSSRNRTDLVYIIDRCSQIEKLKKGLSKNKKDMSLIVVFINISKESVCIDNSFKKVFIYDDDPIYICLLQVMYSIIPSAKIIEAENNFVTQVNALYKQDNRNETVGQTNNIINRKLGSLSVLFSKRSDCIKFFVAVGLLGFMLFAFSIHIFSNNNATGVDFPLPTNEVFLRRDFITEDIDEKINKSKQAISNIVIIGISGSGKTTLIRDYAIAKKHNICWEINSESEMEIIRSFEKLAIVLSKTTAEKKDLECLYFIKDIEFFKVKLLSIVQSLLFRDSDWLLIYDNVDRFKDIVQYLPRNARIWGNGQVIIITKNQNILISKYISNDNVVLIPELSIQEREKLFLKIHSAIAKHPIDNPTTICLQKFLKNIPSFPLDVSTAAYFIKNTGIEYAEYLKYLQNSNSIFINNRDHILKKVDDKYIARYKIVETTINGIIKNNPKFREKLLWISFLDPSNIPMDLLNDQYGRATALPLILDLSRYSLINYNEAVAGKLYFHRSIHNIIYLVLEKYIVSPAGSVQLDLLNKHLAQQLSIALDKEDLKKLKILLPHVEKFIKKVEQYINVDSARYQLGRAYRYLGRFNNAIAILNSVKEQNRDIDFLLELGTNYKHIGKYDDAVQIIESASNRANKQYGPNSIEFARVTIKLDTPYRKIKKNKEAKKLLEHSLQVHEKQKELDLATIAWICTKLGHLNVKLGLLQNGMQLFEKSLAIQSQLYGKNNIRTAWTNVRLANAYKQLKDYDMSGTILKSSLEIYKAHYGESHFKTAWVLCLLGEIEGRQGDFLQAEKHIKEGLQIQRQIYSDENIRLAWFFTKLGDLYKKNKNYFKAKHYLQLATMATQEGP